MDRQDRTLKFKGEGSGGRKTPDSGTIYCHAGQDDELSSIFDLISYVTDHDPALSECTYDFLDPGIEHQVLRSPRPYPEVEDTISLLGSRSSGLPDYTNTDRNCNDRSQLSSCFGSQHETVVQGINPRVLDSRNSLRLQNIHTSQFSPTAINKKVSRHSKEVVAFLKEQLSHRFDNPYFSEHEKAQLAASTGLTVKQINDWLRHTLNRKGVSSHHKTRTIVLESSSSTLCQTNGIDPAIDYSNSNVPLNYTTLPAASPTTSGCSSSSNVHVDNRPSGFDGDQFNLEIGLQSVRSYDGYAVEWRNTECLSPSAALSGIFSKLDQETNRSWDEPTPSSSTSLTNSDDNPAWSHPFTPGTLDETWPSVEAEASESPQYTVARRRRGLSRHGIPSRVRNLSNHENLMSSDLSPSTHYQHFCAPCSIPFSRKGSLTRHTNTQHNQHTSHVGWVCKPILARNKCAICSLVVANCRCHELCFSKTLERDRKFNRADNLKDHFRRVHKVDFGGCSELLHTDLWKVKVAGHLLSNVSSPSSELRETPSDRADTPIYLGGSVGKGDSTG